MIRSQGGARSPGRVRAVARADVLATLSALDREVTVAVSGQRLLTGPQLERLFWAIPARTVRFRAERLARLGVLGRSRPYRDRGTAPFHYWPTRLADTYARGEDLPIGGDRREPNPVFLAHAAGLSELWVELVGGRAKDLRLSEFLREGDAREEFRGVEGPRAIAPDARLELRDAAGRSLVAHVELDRGTMSRIRLKTKAAGYAAYVAAQAWETRYPFCPSLLFVTTTDARASAFLAALAASLRRDWFSAGRSFTAAACAMANEPARALAEPCWRDLTGAAGRTLADCLWAARKPYDAARAREDAEADAQRQRVAELQSDPDLLRRHLRGHRAAALGRWLRRVGTDASEAIDDLLDRDAPLSNLDRDALVEFGRFVGDDLLDFGHAEGPNAGPGQRVQLSRLGAAYRVAQERQLWTLFDTYGSLPCLRAARDRLHGGALIMRSVLDWLPSHAQRQAAIYATQERRAARYGAYREREARIRAALTWRLRTGTKTIATQIDLRVLRRCVWCDETIYPDIRAWRPAAYCAYCDSRLSSLATGAASVG